MPEADPDPATTRFLLTNDDGVEAPGLEALRRAAAGLGRSTIIAPIGPWSSKGHSVTTHEPIRVDRLGEGRMAVDGTPADCVRLGLHHLDPGADWVLSGINAGANLGADIHHSGTAAAAREAAIHGRKAAAFSHYIARGRPIDWSRASRWTAAVLKVLLARPWERGTFWNVNLPHPGPEVQDPPRIVFCPVDPSPLPLSYRVEGDTALYDGDYHSRTRRAGSDVDVCFRGEIAVSRVRLIEEAD